MGGLALLVFVARPEPAAACGDSEAGLTCDDGGTAAEDGARWMLKRVVAAIGTDKARALAAFTSGADGFRTTDTYVFCVGPDGVMSAHPNPILQGHDARDLHDRTGHYFIQTMLRDARPGDVSVIRYLFPKPGSTVAEAKTTYYTRAGDQMCGVGVYDTDQRADGQPATPHARMTELRRRLDGAIPAGVRKDWTAFLELMDEEASAQGAALDKAHEILRAAEGALPARAGRTDEGH